VTAGQRPGREERAQAGNLLAELHDLPEDSPRRQSLRDQLVELHMPLVVYLARRFSGRNEPMNDLVQVGAIGLIKAIDRFDPSRQLEFSTYATPTILGEIKRHFRDTGWLIHVPRRAQELQTTLNAARADLSQ
jgi:RNA polymerase sigma-B factor